MKLLPLLTLYCCSIVLVLSEATETKEQALRARASAQLERLAPYRRIASNQGTSDEQLQLLENAAKDPGIGELSDQQVYEIYRLLPENLQMDIVNQVGGNRAMIEMLANQKYAALMQDRIKRSGSKREVYSHDGYESPPSGYPSPPSGYSSQEYGGYPPEPYGAVYGDGSDSGSILKGSGSLISGIANGIISGLVSASGSASKGSSSISASSSQSSVQSSSSSSTSDRPKPEYGHVYSYGDKAFDVWDFKKAIISTLMQAVKAISGGVIALKGQLLKGSGYLVATKGKIITKTGDAITTLGRNIAKSAVHPHPAPSHPGHLYDHPPEGGHEESYDGPPPSIEEYGEPHEEYHGNSNYESSSDVSDQAGLLIVKPTKPDSNVHHSVNMDTQKPAVTQPQDNYYGPPPKMPGKHVETTVAGHINVYQNVNQEDHNVKFNRPLPTSFDVSNHHSPNNFAKGHNNPLYPSFPSDQSSSNHYNPLSIQQGLEYPPIDLQYVSPVKDILDFPNEDTSSNDLSVYSSFSIDTDPKIESIKISGIKLGGDLELPKFQTQPNFHNVPLLPTSYPTLEEPLKIPLLNQYSTSYWPNQALLQPFTNFNLHGLYQRRSSVPRRRSVNEVAQRMRLRRG